MIKGLEKWIASYAKTRFTVANCPLRHLVIALCDHYEPFHHSDKAGALERVNHWSREWKRITCKFSDHDGHPPKHTFFFPIEQYDKEVVSRVGDLCHQTRSEGGIHLHHSDDSAASLEDLLCLGKHHLSQHGLIGQDAHYPFIHGDWALDNSHPEGKHCGVTGELAVLRKTGCYADFTLPSAPSPTQTRTINSIYYAQSTNHPKSHDHGSLAGLETNHLRNESDQLLIVQGPLGLNWTRRKWGLLPRIENADITGANPPTANRLNLWMQLAPRLACRPDVAFIKLHTHGAIEANSRTLLGPDIERFHETLAQSAPAYHYATAREMVNMIHAYEDGKTGSPGKYRDYLYAPPVV